MQGAEFKKKVTDIWVKTVMLLRKYLGRYIDIKSEPITRKTVKRYAKSILSGSAYTVLSFVLACARLQNGMRPLGIALLCASERKVVYIFVGLIASVFTDKSTAAIGIIGYLSALIMRVLLCRVLGITDGKKHAAFREPTGLRVAVAATCGFIIGIYGIFASNFSTEGLIGTVSAMAVPSVMTFLYGGLSPQIDRFSVRHDLASLALLFSATLASGSITVMGYSPEVLIAFLITLSVAAGSGSLRGGVVGMICGLACSPSSAAMLGIAGVIAGTVKDMGCIVASVSACSVASVFAFITGGIQSLGNTIPSLMWGTALFTPLSKLGAFAKISGYTAIFGSESSIRENARARSAVALRREEDTRKKLCGMSEAMSSLSKVFFSISSDFSSPELYRVRESCESCFRKYCNDCRLLCICWGNEHEKTSDVISMIAMKIAKNGSADPQMLPAEFAVKCRHAKKAISLINLSYARMAETAARENKTEVFAQDYEAMAKLLEESVNDGGDEFRIDRHLTSKVKLAAAELGISAADIAVFGQRKKTVIAGGVDITRLKADAERIRQRISVACGTELTLPEFTVDDDYVTMICTSAQTVVCDSARASVSKINETVNGDSTSAFISSDELFYSVISDGMGSGSDAAVTSRAACIFLEKMLGAGNSMKTVMSMLNNFIRSKSTECFATVDILKVDLITAEASFIKSGAASSYVLRGGKLFKISSESMPIGITREITAEEIKLSLLPSDLVVMVSDGVAQSLDDGAWFAELLSKIDLKRSLDNIASEILDYAKRINLRSDDMTVALVRIEGIGKREELQDEDAA